MYDQIMDTYRRAAESTMQLQQSILQNWTHQFLPQMFTPAIPGAAAVERLHKAQKQFGDTLTGLLNRHRELLDGQYKAGIKAIDDAFKLGGAKDPEHFRKLSEELWKHSFEALRKVTEDQTREFQAAVQKWTEVMTKGVGHGA